MTIFKWYPYLLYTCFLLSSNIVSHHKLHQMCLTKNCRKPKVRHRRYCHSCVKRKYARAHPMRYAYMVLRQNARRRKKPFQLCYEAFRMFAFATHYTTRKGVSRDSWSIDRIQNEYGYTPSNIRLVPVPFNSSKGDKGDFVYPF